MPRSTNIVSPGAKITGKASDVKDRVTGTVSSATDSLHSSGGSSSGGGGLTAITLFRTGQAAEGRLTLVFSDQPTELRQWVVVDAQARETRVSLYQPEYGGRFPNLLFDFNDPRFREELGIP